MAAAESSLTGLYTKLSVIADKDRNLESANARLQKELETLPSTHAKARTSLAMVLSEACDDLVEKMGEPNTLKAKVDNL